MKSSFKPNGGKNVRQSSSYAKAKSLCHHAIAELYGNGRVGVSFASFEAIRGINPISTFSVYLPAISNFYVVNRVFNNFNRASNAKKMASTLALVNHVSGAFVEIDKNSIISGSYLQGI
jgi:hypothetical protein